MKGRIRCGCHLEKSREVLTSFDRVLDSLDEGPVATIEVRFRCSKRTNPVDARASVSDNARKLAQGPEPHPLMYTDERTAAGVRLLHAIFEDQARETPHAEALDVPPRRAGDERVRLSYAELDESSNRLAAALASHVRGECVVAILL